MNQAAGEGYRLLAVAFRTADVHQRELKFADIQGGFPLLGVCAMQDPPREEAIDAVARCRAAGIHVKMITGDHASTARAIGTQLGIGMGSDPLTGEHLEKMNDEQLRTAVTHTDVFARASPAHKLRLVQALQAEGHVVAMTGDGVNDAPALKRADVGVAMGIKGTEVAKESSEMVLADDNFASITAAVEEGRTVYDNLRKSILFMLPTNGGEAGIIIVAILFGIALPITPVQILWVNMVTEITLSLVLAFETPELNIMQRPPRSPTEPLLSKFLLWRIVFVSLLLVCGALGLYFWETARGVSLESARTVAVNALVVGEMFYLFNSRYILAPSLTRIGILGNRYVWLAIGILIPLQLLFTYVPFMQRWFGTDVIDATAWAKIILFGVILLLVVELEKYIARRRAEAGGDAVVKHWPPEG
jgi:magnesium-transporting ATPase (P-type)